MLSYALAHCIWRVHTSADADSTAVEGWFHRFAYFINHERKTTYFVDIAIRSLAQMLKAWLTEQNRELQAYNDAVSQLEPEMDVFANIVRRRPSYSPFIGCAVLVSARGALISFR